MDSVRNDSGVWINSSYFCDSAKHFTKHGFYCPFPKDSLEWKGFWDEELLRIREGYSVGGARITGDHYHYLNYTPIKKSVIGKRRKIVGFPDFWDGDYNYQWAVDIAAFGMEYDTMKGLYLEHEPKQLDGGHHITVGKARRKGFSYKYSSKVAKTYTTEPDSLSVIGAWNKKYLYPKGTMTMVLANLSFLNRHTPFGKKRDWVDQQGHIEASYKEVTEYGLTIKGGYESQVMALSFKDNPDALRGQDATLIGLEEGGTFPLLLDSLGSLRPCVEDGDITTGQIIVYGTSSLDIEGSTADFIKLFYEPAAYNFVSFDNVWDNDSEETTCSFFFSAQQNFVGHIDKNGNSDKVGAIEALQTRREKIKTDSSSAEALHSEIVEYPFSPEEGFKIARRNAYPTVELNALVSRLLKSKDKGVPVDLSVEEGVATYKPHLAGELEPIDYYPFKSLNLFGAVMMYEPPILNPPAGLYVIGYDPYEQDDGTSLGGVVVFKKDLLGEKTRNIVVATYLGRPNTSDDMNRIVMLLADIYNATIMYENTIKDVYSYFARQKKLHRLMDQPNYVISQAIKKSRVHRKKGIHISPEIRGAATKYTVNYLLKPTYDRKSEKEVLYLDMIPSLRLAQELLFYDPNKNFDLHDAFHQVMIAIEEDLGTAQKAPAQSQDVNVEYLIDKIKRYHAQRQINTTRQGGQ